MALLKTGLPVAQQGRETGGSKSLQGQTGNHSFAVPVSNCLHSHHYEGLMVQLSRGESWQ